MTTCTTSSVRGLSLLAILVLFVVAPLVAHAATITIVNNDGAGEGFNDPTARAPVGGNPGTTLGAQRLNVFQQAANIWGSILTSPVTIVVRAQFNPQTCTATSAVLGSAAPVTVHRDFGSAEFAGHWYHAALANKREGVDLNPPPGSVPPNHEDINATFNSNIDAGCFGPGLVWYYGLDGNEGSNIELLPVVLHEIGHGLGFSTLTDGFTGAYLASFPSVFDKFLFDNVTGLHWDQMSNAQRQASAINGNLVWDGFATTYTAPTFLSHRGRMTITAPGGIAGEYTAQIASFGGALTIPGLAGNVVLVNDGTGTTTDACEPLVNGAAVNGNIALIDRGTCPFTAKALAAQNAGAIGVIVANNAAGLPPMGGADPAVTIPVIGISQADGNSIKANLPGVSVNIGLHPTFLAGADNSGKVLMFAPNPFQGGSSVSHWDTSLFPDALMEPALNTGPSNQVDLTRYNFEDIGWFQPRTTGVGTTEPTAGVRLAPNAPNPFGTSTSITYSLDRSGVAELAIYDVTGRALKRLWSGYQLAGRHVATWDGTDGDGHRVAAGVYVYRLKSNGNSVTRRAVLLP